MKINFRIKPKLLGEYINGNYKVSIYNDGTRVKETLDEAATQFIAQFPDSCDMKITNQCEMNCPMCHEASTPDGKHAFQLLSHPVIANLHPYTEVAIGGGNPLSHPQLIEFLELLKEKKVIANMTVNYKHFVDNLSLINSLVEDNLIKGIGISANIIDDNLIYILEHYPNVVLHTINGLITPEEIQKLYGRAVKVLILGYKEFRKGETLYTNNKEVIDKNKEWMYNHVTDFIKNFKVISFDELALQQLDVKNAVSQAEWDLYYQGGDGQSTMFVDMVEETFSKSSISKKRYNLNAIKSLDEALEIIQNEEVGI